MKALLSQIHYATSANLSLPEIILLSILAIVVWHNRKAKSWLPPIYCVFLIVYITLLRRASGYNESLRLHLKLWSGADVWAGNLLNLILYIPLGWTSQRWKHSGKQVCIMAFVLSVLCETLQYLTGRGTADINDVIFNTLGAIVGVWLAEKRSGAINKQ